MGRHEFPFKNHVCFAVNEVRDVKRKPAPLLTKLNECSPSANKILDKQRIDHCLSSKHISRSTATDRDPISVTSDAIFNDKIGCLQAYKEFNIMLLAHEENHVHLLGGYKQPYVLEMHLMEDGIFHVLHLSYCFLLIQLACFKIVLIY